MRKDKVTKDIRTLTDLTQTALSIKKIIENNH